MNLFIVLAILILVLAGVPKEPRVSHQVEVRIRITQDEVKPNFLTPP